MSAASNGLRLRPVRASDEAAFRAAHAELAAEDFPFGLGYEPDAPWDGFRRSLDDQRRGLDLPDGLVPATFVVADVAGTLVGRSSIRHELNDYLAREGGHIGYAVLAAHRGRGYATEILRQSLVIARAVGVDRVLITCADDNIASARVIERCGGVFESLVDTTLPGGGPPTRRYWID
jgi:predicted acetyltransferase